MGDLDRLNHILAELEDAPTEDKRLVTEHLEGARYYLTGGMPEEYAFNLKLVRESLGSLSNEHLKSEIQEFIDAER